MLLDVREERSISSANTTPSDVRISWLGGSSAMLAIPDCKGERKVVSFKKNMMQLMDQVAGGSEKVLPS